MSPGLPTHVVFALAATLAALCGSCSRSEIEIRRIPKENWQVAEDRAGDPSAYLRGRIDWTIPYGWESLAPTALLKGNYRWPEAAEPPLHIEIASFPGAAGGLLANVNRWRTQLGFSEEISQEALDSFLETRTIQERVAAVADIRQDEADPPMRLISTSLQYAGQSWFFNIVGAADDVEQKRPDYESLLDSLVFIDRIDRSPEAGGDKIAENLVFQAPEFWIREEEFSSARYASYRIPAEDMPDGDFSVTYVDDAYAGLVANANRWRRQLQLEPWTQAEAQANARKFVWDKLDFIIVDIWPSANGEEEIRTSRRIVAAILEQSPRVWFFKLEGPYTLVESQLDAFENTLKSVSFHSAIENATPPLPR